MADRVQARAERERVGAGITKEYIQRDNHGFSYRFDDEELGDDDRTGPKPHIDEPVVWGGTVANCAESALSSTVDQEAKFLREVVYAPSRKYMTPCMTCRRPTHPRPASVAISTTFISATGTAAARELTTAPRHRGDHFHHLSSLMHSYSCMHTSGATHRSPLDRWSIGTKGGCLVRPKYHMGDRGGRQTFPRLERMTIRARPALLPSR